MILSQFKAFKNTLQDLKYTKRKSRNAKTQFFQRVDEQTLETSSVVSAASFPVSSIQFLYFRDLTLHQNRWHCDCHLLALHNWLQNFTVPNSVEPRCHSPPRLINEPIKSLAPTEFACIPKVSPTSMYLEVIEGKNMSLVCTIEVIILCTRPIPRSIVLIFLCTCFASGSITYGALFCVPLCGIYCGL